MKGEYLLKSISFKSIFKMIMIPMTFLFIISLFWIMNDQFLQQVQLSASQSDQATKSLFEHASTSQYKSFVSTMFLIILLIMNLVLSTLTWFSMRLYLLFFVIKIRGDIVPLAHDQMDALVDDTQ